MTTYAAENDDLSTKNKQSTIGYWQKLEKEMWLETPNIDQWTDDRRRCGEK